MKLNDFMKDIASARERAQTLRESIDDTGVHQDDVLFDAVEQLQTTVEELQVAQEELHQQNEELLSTRSHLEEERQRYQELFEFAPDPYLLTDQHGLILEANRAAESLFGLERRFLIRKPIVSFVHETDHASLRKLLTRLNEASSANDALLNLRIIPRLREPLDAAVKIAVSRDAKGRPTKLRWLLQDITERVKAQREIRALNAELEDRVQRRTAELQQANALKDELLARAKRAQAEAEAANRSKDEFLAIASHELRTPLTAIQGWAEILTRGGLDEKMTERGFETIARNVKAQTQIITDLLDVSRMLSGKLQIETHPVDLVPVVEAAIDIVRPSANVEGITINHALDPEAGMVLGDPARLQQIVWNLLSNAVKFTARGGIVDVRLKRTDGKVSVIVQDNGAGISPEFLPHIFEPFRQADSKTTRKFGGLGLGLAIVRSLVESQGGSVRAESAGEGQGATFTANFPLAIKTGQTESSQKRAAGSPCSSKVTSEPPSLEGLRLLVVDDDADSQGMLNMALTRHGGEVQACSSVSEAIEKLKDWLPDVIISDIGMPSEDGYQLMSAVRDLPKEHGGSIPALALTGYAAPADQKKALAAGYQMHMSKPVEINKLVTAVWGLASGKG